jgi:aquaporin Z
MNKQKATSWSAYAMEAFGLFGFVLIAGLLTIFLEHPDLPVMQSSWKHYPLLRRLPLGITLGIYVYVVSRVFGKKSGALINPAVTWALYRQGTIQFKDAVWYTIAQFTGAVIGAQLIKLFFYTWFSHPDIQFGVTRPLPPHQTIHAFIAECIISFLVMATLLLLSSIKKWEKYLPIMMGIWIALFLIFELPYSGMSMNPARSFAGALAANRWEHLWIYFAAPIPSMLFAGELFLIWRKWQLKKEVIQEQTNLQRIQQYPAT